MGPGAGWILEHATELLGLHDTAAGFEPRLPFLRALAERFGGIRIARTRAVAEAVAPSVLERIGALGAAAAHRTRVLDAEAPQWRSSVHNPGSRRGGPAQ